MALFSAPARLAQAPTTYACDANGIHRSGSITACALASIAACALIFSAAAQNVAHAYGLGLARSEFAAYVLAAASAGAALLGPFAWLYVIRGRSFGTRVTALVMAVGCLTYAGVCSLGFVANSRDSATAAISERLDAYRDRRAVMEAARAELASLKGQDRRTIERRRELQALLTAPAVEAKAVAKPDSQAAALAFYLRAAGYHVTDEAVGTWLNLGTVLFLELAAALSLTVAAGFRPSRQISPVAAVSPAQSQTPAKPEIAASGPESRPSDDKDDDTPPPPRGKAGRPATVQPAEAVARLRKAGGKVDGSLGSVGRLLGAKSKTTAHRLLHRLAEAGQVRLAATPHGVSIALA